MSKKKKGKTNPRSRPVNGADLNRMQKQATDEAATMVWTIFFSVLFDKEGYDREGLERVWKEVTEKLKSLGKYCTIADMRNTLKEEAGFILK